MRVRLSVFITLALIISTFGLPSRAQTASASILGTIVTDDGTALPGVTVTIRCKCSTTCPSDPDCACCPAATYVTDASGKFHFVGLAPGQYEMRAELSGYSASSRSVTVSAGGEQEVHIVMRSSVTATRAR